MLSTSGWLSLAPPVIAIAVACGTKRVLSALLAGIVCAMLILSSSQPYLAPVRALDYLIETLAAPDSLRLVVFSVLVGGLLKLIRDSGGFDAFALALGRWRGAYGKPTVYSLTWIFGASLILETWSNVLINGVTMGSLYERLGISRARLAYFVHTIGINVVALVLINSWGAFYLALVTAQGVNDPLQLVIAAMPYALYCWISLLVVAAVMFGGFTPRSLRELERGSTAVAPPIVTNTVDARAPLLRHMFVPIASLLGIVFLGLWATGQGSITAGDGSASILYAVVGTILLTVAMLRIDGVFTTAQAGQKVVDGSSQFLKVGVLIVMALALGKLTKDLGTGQFVAQLLQTSMPTQIIPALVFVIGAIMSFATGTSYGTFSIMVPIALPIGAATGIDPALLLGACIAGGVFGDNCSPISDTSIVTSLATGVPVVDHTRTQLPFALVAAALATLGYLWLGAIS
jgi:tetracycline resistance efflux pump